MARKAPASADMGLLISDLVKQQALDALKSRNVFTGESSMPPAPKGRNASVQELMAEDPLAFDYMVDITRQPLDPDNPDLGWVKHVERKRVPKDEKKKKAKR